MEQPESDSESSDTMPALCDSSAMISKAHIDKLFSHDVSTAYINQMISTEEMITSMMFKGTREYDCEDHMIVEDFVKSLSQLLSVDHKNELISIILKSQKLDTTIVARKLIDYVDKEVLPNLFKPVFVGAKDFDDSIIFDTETL